MNTLTPMPKGGKREGSGPKPKDPSGIKRGRRWFFLTPKEYTALKEALERMRREADSAKSDSTYDA